jgi:hypothetical protein
VWNGRSDAAIRADEFTRKKDDIEAAMKTVVRLNDSGSGAARRQTTAIDWSTPYMKECAGNTAAAIDWLNTKQEKPLIIGKFEGLHPMRILRVNWQY